MSEVKMSQSLFQIDSSCGALILAAGRGTRMHSRNPKVLQTLLGEPLLMYVVRALEPLFGDAVWAVVGHGAEMVRKVCAGYPLRFVEQTELLGTGHALMVALPALRAAGMKRVLVVNGDTPLITTETFRRFLRDAEGAAVAVATLTLPSPGAYGRVVRHQDRVIAIVEAKDYDPVLHGPEPDEINAGIYLFDLESVEKLLPRLENNNKNKEYYITDLIRLAVDARMRVSGLHCGSDPHLLGINTPEELARSEELLRRHLVRSGLEAGIIMHGSASVRLGPRVTVEPGAELYGPCEIYGRSHIASGAVVEAFCHIVDSHIGPDAVIRSFSHLDRAMVGPECTVGPYARLRPDAVMEQGAHVGNFVEMKKAVLGAGAKANHLTYLGDADVGPGSNIGAGTITCNYDGVNKHRTSIGAHAFIGSNTALVAPVSVGNNAVVGAGSVITRNVPDECLGVTRARQKILPRRRLEEREN